MTADEARTHLRYSGWASGRLLKSALALDEEKGRRDLSISHKSLLGTLEHIFFGDRVWFARVADPSVIGGAWMEFGPGESLSTDWPKLQKRWEDWSRELNDADLLRGVDYRDLKGNSHTTPVWQIVMHVVNHATLHRGQAMAMLRQLGVAPPPTDLIYYYRELSSQ